MKLRLLLLVLAARFAVAGIVGHWDGILDFPAGKLRFVLHVNGPDTALTATADSPNQGAFNLPIDSLTFKDDFLRFRMSAQGVVFGGELDENRIRGIFSQNGVDIPVILNRSVVVARKRPPPSLFGDWSGRLDTPRGSLRFVLHCSADGATADSSDENIAGIPLDSISVEGKNIAFNLTTIYASFQGTISGREIRGTFHQGGYGLPLILRLSADRPRP